MCLALKAIVPTLKKQLIVFWILVGVRTDLGPGPSSSKEKQHTGFVTESSLSLAYFVLIIDTKETLVENFRILQFPVPVL